MTEEYLMNHSDVYRTKTLIFSKIPYFIITFFINSGQCANKQFYDFSK